jgi:MYXO-CTERM domain-containing protein
MREGCRVHSTTPSRQSRLALGVVGLVLLFGLGYRISLHRLQAPVADVSAR